MSKYQIICPTCGRQCSPVYCAVSTSDNPLLLAYTTAQAAKILGISRVSLYERVEAWQGGWRLVLRQKDRTELRYGIEGGTQ